MKLFVDDYRPAPRGWHWAKTVSEAIRVLDTMDIDCIALDHDIMNSAETFEAVARHFAILVRADKQYKTTPIYIHTGNPVGGQKMIEILRLAGCVNITPVSYDYYLDGKEDQQKL